MMDKEQATEVSRREMRNLVRWRHHLVAGAYKCKADCRCRTKLVVVNTDEDVEDNT